MKTTHVSDHDIQQFAFDLPECEPAIIKHINSCETCKKRVDIYLSLSNTIKDQPEPILEFNLAELVLDQLPSSTKKEMAYSYFIYFLIIVSIGVVVSTLYFFKDSFIELFSNVTAIPIYFITSITLLISFALGLDIVRTFNKKINMLNY